MRCALYISVAGLHSLELGLEGVSNHAPAEEFLIAFLRAEIAVCGKPRPQTTTHVIYINIDIEIDRTSLPPPHSLGDILCTSLTVVLF